MNTIVRTRPGVVGRLRSRQSGLPTGLFGRIIGRAIVRATAESNDRALAELDLTEPRTVLDVGFGQGRTATSLLRHGHRVIGVDASPTMVKQATARNRVACRDGRATLRHGDGITIPFPHDSADAAITAHTIYFMPDPAATMSDIARVLRPGGTLVVACRTSDTTTPAWMDPEVYRIPSADDILAMLQAAGFKHIEQRPGDTSNHDIHLFVARLSADAASNS
jgi:SAM-dependent methyltransferase